MRPIHPKLMVVSDSPYFVHLGHQAMKKQSYQTQFINLLNKKITAGELESLDYRIFRAQHAFLSTNWRRASSWRSQALVGR